MAGREVQPYDRSLAKTRVMPVSHRAVAERPDAILAAPTQTALADAVSQGGARAVGRYTRHEGGYAVPVVYVSKRAQGPWVMRHRKALLWTGVPLLVLSLLALLVLWVGWAWFIAGTVAAGVFVAGLVRFANGGGSRRGGGKVSVNVSVSNR
jgi:hypothetical protein